jgi:hypothetical protein
VCDAGVFAQRKQSRVRRPGVVRICDSLVSLALKRQDVAWRRVPQGWIRLQRLRRLRRRAILNAVWLARLEACMRPENPTRILGVPCSSVSSYLFAAKRPAAVCSHRPTGGSSAPGPMCGFIVCLTRAFLHLPLENHRWVLVISPRFPLPSFAFCPCGEAVIPLPVLSLLCYSSLPSLSISSLRHLHSFPVYTITRATHCKSWRLRNFTGAKHTSRTVEQNNYRNCYVHEYLHQTTPLRASDKRPQS